MPVTDSYSLRLKSTPAASSMATETVQQWIAEWEIPDELGEMIMLAVAEAVSNAAEHGNRLDAGKDVILLASKEEQEILISVEDQGIGLPEERLLNAELPTDPLDVRGRGLYIISEIVPRVWLEAEGRRLCMAWDVE